MSDTTPVAMFPSRHLHDGSRVDVAPRGNAATSDASSNNCWHLKQRGYWLRAQKGDGPKRRLNRDDRAATVKDALQPKRSMLSLSFSLCRSVFRNITTQRRRGKLDAKLFEVGLGMPAKDLGHGGKRRDARPGGLRPEAPLRRTARERRAAITVDMPRRRLRHVENPQG